jgi:hypothetical protein
MPQFSSSASDQILASVRVLTFSENRKLRTENLPCESPGLNVPQVSVET